MGRECVGAQVVLRRCSARWAMAPRFSNTLGLLARMKNIAQPSMVPARMPRRTKYPQQAVGAQPAAPSPEGVSPAKSQTQAYIEAGFSPKGARGAASTLLKQDLSILERRDEILNQREQLQTKALAQAARAEGVSRETHLRTLAELRD